MLKNRILKRMRKDILASIPISYELTEDIFVINGPEFLFKWNWCRYNFK
jgi:hypothetical protein